MASRLGRIYHETGLVGLLLRPLSRTLIQISEGLGAVSRAALGRVPLRWLTPHRLQARLAKNAIMKDRHRGERCFILGNGPSLALENTALLREEVLLTCNQGHQFLEMHGLRPRYHFFVDSIFLEPNFSGFLDQMLELHRNQDVTLITSTLIGEVLQARGAGNSFHELHQFLISDYATPPADRWPDLTEAQFGFLSVIHAALYSALYMGFREIYLLGCDMDFFIDPDKTFVHSYGQGRFGDSDKSASELFGWGQIDLMAWCLREFRGFEALRLLGETRGVQIVNAGQGGALNVFPRQPLPAILNSNSGHPC